LIAAQANSIEMMHRDRILNGECFAWRTHAIVAPLGGHDSATNLISDALLKKKNPPIHQMFAGR
jgi:hypothetical protein